MAAYSKESNVLNVIAIEIKTSKSTRTFLSCLLSIISLSTTPAVNENNQTENKKIVCALPLIVSTTASTKTTRIRKATILCILYIVNNKQNNKQTNKNHM